MAVVARKARVSGRVQGVWFRKNTKDQALKLNLIGSAINLSDGSVEVVVQGEDAQVNELLQWLWKGSPLSRVDDVQIESLDLMALSDFTTG